MGFSRYGFRSEGSETSGDDRAAKPESSVRLLLRSSTPRVILREQQAEKLAQSNKERARPSFVSTTTEQETLPSRSESLATTIEGGSPSIEAAGDVMSANKAATPKVAVEVLERELVKRYQREVQLERSLKELESKAKTLEEALVKGNGQVAVIQGDFNSVSHSLVKVG